jgi:hypothetical protein
MTAALLVVTVCTLALGGVLAVRRRRDGRPTPVEPFVGSPAPLPELVGTTPTGAPVRAGLATPGEHTLLAFLTSSCATCRGLWAEFDGDLPRRLPVATIPVIVTEDAADERVEVVRDLAPGGVPVLMSSATWRAFGVTAAPYFVLVDGASGGILAAGSAADGRALVRLVRPSSRG